MEHAMRGAGLGVLALISLVVVSRTDHEVITAIALMLFIASVGGIFFLIHRLTGN